MPKATPRKATHQPKHRLSSKSNGNGAPVIAVSETRETKLIDLKTKAGLDLSEKIRELLRLAKDQGHLTYEDLNEILGNTVQPEDLDQVHIKLRNLDIDILDPSEVETTAQAESDEEEPEPARFDLLDDPVRMYMKQMGRV